MVIVRIAPRRPRTFMVLATLILRFGGRSRIRTATDIFTHSGIRVRRMVHERARRTGTSSTAAPERSSLPHPSA